MKHIRFNVLVALVLVSKYVLKKVDGYDGDFSVNVAYGKPANQSSAYRGNTFYGEPNGFPYIASLAVDGIKTTNFLGNSCSHTALGQSSPWWEVNLQGLYDVSSIKIYQRDDSNQNSLEGFVVDGMQSDANYITINYSGPYSTGVITISLQPKRQLQPIRIRLPKDNAFICLCEVEVFADNDECRTGDSVCHNHGQCTNTDGGFTCQCRTGYTGLTCQTDIDECSSRVSVCHNQGWCTNTVGNFTCQCTNGYTGRRCETDIDECTQAGICQYHGQCFNTDGSFSCNCSAGYDGTMCENDIDECTQAGICQYHGQCSNTDGSFACNFSAGYNGTTCENALLEMNADHEQSMTYLIGWVITGALCLILLVTNIVTCLRLRRHESFKRKKRNNTPDDVTTAHNVNARDDRAQAKVNEGMSAYEFVEDPYMETLKNKSNGSENNAMEPYDNLQLESRSKSEYDKLTFERESSLKTT